MRDENGSEATKTATTSDLGPQRLPYEAPQLVRYGCLRDLTTGGSAGLNETRLNMMRNRLRP